MSFCISIIKEPIYVWDERRQCNVINWDETSGDHHLSFDFDYHEFEAVQKFIDASPPYSEYSKDEVWIEYHQRKKAEYCDAAAAKGYEMLGRFWYEFDDAIYLSTDVERLREECLKAKSESQNPDLITAADKILEACNDALKTDSGLLFGCD